MVIRKLVVMSDFYGDCDIVKDIKNYYLGKVDVIFYNGDFEFFSLDFIWEGIYVVIGNCDYDLGYLEVLVIKIDNIVIV